MHVLILADFGHPGGGAERVALDSASALAEAGAQVTFVHAVGEADATAPSHPRIRRIGLGLADVWERPVWRAAAEGVWNREAARRLAATLAGLPSPPDVIHLHQWTRGLSPAVFPVLFRTGLPLAVTLHDYFVACPNGVYYRFDTGRPCALVPLSAACLAAPCDPRSSLHKLVRVARSVATRRALAGRTLDLVHVSDRARAELSRLLAGLGPFRHHRVDNPVGARRTEPAGPKAALAAAYVGRLTREKGADLVALAARDAGMPSLFIGTGPLEAEIRGIEGAEVLGWRPPEAVGQILRSRVRCLAAPSRWYETGPLTVYEALAAGIPVVASDRSGAAEKVVPGVTGLICAPERAALADAFRRLADDALVERMGAQAHARYWAAPLSLAVHARALLVLYAGMIRDRDAPAAIPIPRPDPLTHA